MYTHLKVTSVIPVVVTGYKMRGKIVCEYGSIKINAECDFPENSKVGILRLVIYRDDRSALLESAAADEERELVLLRKSLPERDLLHVLSLFGFRREIDVYENRRRVQLEALSGRGRKPVFRTELDFSQSVDELWLKAFGALFGYKGGA